MKVIQLFKKDEGSPNFLFLLMVILVGIYSSFILVLGLYMSKDSNITSICTPLNFMDSDLNTGISCPQDERLDAVVIVITANYNFDKRRAIRETWGNIDHYFQRGYNIRVFFFVGKVTVKHEEKELRLTKERLIHNDILIVNIDDTYRNIVRKHLFALNFLRRKCMNSKLVIKTDDDVYVDIVGLIRTKYSNSVNKQSILCSMHYGYPVREPDSKWFVDTRVFGGDYPPYCFGSFYSMNISSVERISQMANCHPYFWVEDAFITGLMRAQAGIPVHDLAKLAYIPVGVIDEKRVGKLATPDNFLLVYHDGLDAKSMYLLFDVYKELLTKNELKSQTNTVVLSRESKEKYFTQSKKHSISSESLQIS